MIAAHEHTPPVFLLAAGVCPLLSENPHPGHQLSTAVLHRGFTFANSTTAIGLRVPLYDFRVGPRSTGKERDSESGLDYFETRYFSSAQGRFTSPDQPFAGQHAEDPQSWNMYAYVRNNPLRYTDPDGRDCFEGLSSCGNYLLGGLKALGNVPADIINAPNRLADAILSLTPTSFRFGDIAPSPFQASNYDQQQGIDAVHGVMLVSPLAEAGAAAEVGATARAASGLTRAEQLAANAERGAASEARVLSDMGLTKNTTPIGGTAGKSIPDINTSAMVGDVKDVKVVSNTAQMRIQREVAGQTGREHVVVTGTNTHVTAPVRQPPTRIIRRDDLGPN